MRCANSGSNKDNESCAPTAVVSIATYRFLNTTSTSALVAGAELHVATFDKSKAIVSIYWLYLPPFEAAILSTPYLSKVLLSATLLPTVKLSMLA